MADYVKYCPNCKKRVENTYTCEHCRADLNPSKKDIEDSTMQGFMDYLSNK